MTDTYAMSRKRFENDPTQCFIEVARSKKITLDVNYYRQGAGSVHFGVNEGNSEQMLDVVSMMEYGGAVTHFAPGVAPDFKSVSVEFAVNGRRFSLGRFSDGQFGLFAALPGGHGLLMPL